MVLILNYLPAIIACVVLYFLYRNFKQSYKSNRGQFIRRSMIIVGIGIAVLVLLTALTAGYIPKNSVPRLPNPEDEIDKTNQPVIEDRLRKPAKTDAQSKADFDKMVDWRNKPANNDDAVESKTKPVEEVPSQ